MKKEVKKTVKNTQKKAVNQINKTEAKPKKESYFEGLGRRKTAIARVRLLTQDKKTNLVNGKDLEKYFQTQELQQTIFAPLKKMDLFGNFGFSVRVKGGGINSQAEAVRHGIAKCLVLFNPEMRKKLKKAGYLTRDSRMRERKKFGLKRARRAPQWSKR